VVSEVRAGLPQLLLVDDSEAILAFETAVLSAHYAIATASDGRAALAQLARLRPAAVLLDLSMPELDGEAVLAHMQADPALRDVPVIVVSSEVARAEACLARGAAAALPKPIRADELSARVARVIDEAAARRRRGSLACLPVGVGPLELALALDEVRLVAPQAATRPLAAGPEYLGEMLEVWGAPVLVLDAAAALGVGHAAPLLERKLVVVDHRGQRVAVCVDRVRDPEEFAGEDLLPAEHVGGARHGRLGELLRAVVRSPRGALPVLAAAALFDAGLLARAAAVLVERERP
jgi:CheY-like chemotaxis protein